MYIAIMLDALLFLWLQTNYYFIKLLIKFYMYKNTFKKNRPKLLNKHLNIFNTWFTN